MGILKKLTKLFGPSEIKILKEKGDVEGLIQLMERFPHDYCGAIFKALGELGDERAVEPILKTLEKKPKTFLTVEAINAFRKIGSDRAVAALSKLLENPKTNHDEHIKIINALGEIRSESAIEQLINMLGDYLM
jgi:HEAT repeat protein